jgi:hypothetical protein
MIRPIELRHLVAFLTCIVVPQITWAAFCGEDATGKGSFTYFARKCPGGYEHPDPHKEAILRLVTVSVAVQEAQRERARRFGVETGLTGRPTICDSFLDDLLTLSNVQVVHQGAIPWQSISRGIGMPNLDPGFNEWRTNGKTIVVGYVVVRWRNTETFLIRLQRQCAGSDDEQKACQRPAIGFFNVHDSTAERVACFFQRG